MPLEGTDLFVVQRQTGGSPLLKATATQLNSYVSKTLNEVTLKGNNSNQDITLGTDKITLDAGTGAATFAGDVQSGGSPYGAGSGTGARLDSDGAIVTRRSSGDVFTGKSTANNGATTSSISAEGSATFAGNVTSTDGTNSSSIRPGYMVINSPADFGQVIGCYTGSSYSWNITAAGSATFAGDAFAIESNGQISTNIRSQGNIELDSTGAFTSPKIKLWAITGNADFAGSVTVGGDPTFGANTGSQIQSGGVINSCRAGSLAVWYGWQEGNTTETSAINADGSASFAGDVQQGLETASDPGNLIYAAGGYYARFAAGDTTSTGLQIKNGTSDAAVIMANGAATFAGALEAESIDGGTY